MTHSPGSAAPLLAALTSIGLGGPAPSLTSAATAAEVAELVGAADRAGGVLVLGGGSNLVVADTGIDVPVVQVAVPGVEVDAESGVATIGAGEAWDPVVALLVDQGWAGVEALSGIPGSTGATPVQNVGAYGVELRDVLVDVELYRRDTGEVECVPASALRLGYRSSVLKGTDCAVVTRVRLQLSRTPGPVRYPELARLLGVEVGDFAPAAEVRAAVLELRRSKGMVLDAGDPDTASAGSFFTNPIVTADQLVQVRAAVAARLGPDVAMPEYPVPADPSLIGAKPTHAEPTHAEPTHAEPTHAGPTYAGPTRAGATRAEPAGARPTQGQGAPAEFGAPDAIWASDANSGVPRHPIPSRHADRHAAKLSAAWLIERAGFPKGYPLTQRPDAAIALSTKHTLALTNRGHGTTAELLLLAREIRDGVRAAFGVTLRPEPVLVGCSLD